MSVLAGLLLILVPAPQVEAEPSGPAPTLQFVKWNKGSFEQTVMVVKIVPVLKEVTENVNGAPQKRLITTNVMVQESVRQTVDGKGAEVYGIDGKKSDEADWRKSLSNGAVVLLATDGNLPHPAYRKVLKEGTLIVVTKPARAMPAMPVKELPPMPGKELPR